MARADTEAASLLERGGVIGPPVDADGLAKLVGAVIVAESLDPEVSGVLYRRHDTVVIAVNRDHALTRRRFTIAHELGHLLLHQGRPLIVDHVVRAKINLRDRHSSLATDREEIEANSFAANLLMPAELVNDELAKQLLRGPGEQQAIDALARRFRVSPQAMEFRLINLGLRAAV